MAHNLTIRTICLAAPAVRRESSEPHTGSVYLSRFPLARSREFILDSRVTEVASAADRPNNPLMRKREQE
jgi:hypothetical protein